MSIGKGFFDVVTNATQINTTTNGIDVNEALYQGGISETYSEKIVYVGSGSTLLNGSDTDGDGTINAPYATLNKAFEVCPTKWFQLTGSTSTNSAFYRIRVLSGSRIAGTNINCTINGYGLIPRIFIEGWSANTASFGQPNDERFVILSGALTVTSTSIYQNRPVYTLGTGVITGDDQWLGEMVRIYSASVEVGRGVVARSYNSTRQLLVQDTLNGRSPTTSDILYIVRPSAQIGGATPGASRFNINGCNIQFHTIRSVDLMTFITPLTVTLSQTQFVANGGSGAVNSEQAAGAVGLSNLSTSTLITPGGSSYPGNDTSLSAPSVLVRIGGGFVSTGPLTLNNAVIIGNIFAPTGPNMRALVYQDFLGGSIHRGGIIPQPRPNNLTISVSAASNPTRPILWMPYNVTTFLQLVDGCQMNIISSDSTYATVAVDAASMAGTLIVVNNSRGTGHLKMIAADTAVTGSPYFLVDVQAEGVFGVQKDSNIINTTVGTSGVFKAGDQPAQTGTSLFALSGSRSTDTFKLASIRAV